MVKRDTPVDYTKADRDQVLAIVAHPAVRLGFLDAQAKKPIDHFNILDRIVNETPPGALRRLGWRIGAAYLFHSASDQAALAEYRYEEGRLLHIDLGLRCKAWNHPDYPPASVRAWIDRMFPPPAPPSLPGERAA